MKTEIKKIEEDIEEIKKTLEEILIIVKKEQCLSDIERDIKYQQSMMGVPHIR